MKKDNTKLENINTLLKERVIASTTFRQDNGEQFLPGQVWKTNSKSEKFPFVMILEEIEKDQSYNVAPIFRWTEKAGPEDLFIPNNFVGTPMIISFELEFSISVESLKTCKGILGPKELVYIMAARDSLENEAIENETYPWGWEYLDQYDNRYKYHEELAAEIEQLQNKLINLVENIKEQATNGMIIPFIRSSPVAIAAEGTLEVLHKTYAIENLSNIKIIFSEIDNSSLCNMYVYDEVGEISTDLDGSRILDANRNEIAVIDKNHVEFEKSNIEKGCYLVDCKGQPLLLTECK